MECSSNILQPLLLKTGSQESLEESSKASCLLCEQFFDLVEELNIFVKHLFEVHNLVIEDVQHICNLPEYISHWRMIFKETSIDEVVPSVKVDGTPKIYFLLSTLLKEDKELRHKLKLEKVLKQQEFERTDTNYKKSCLFCKLNFEGSRPEFIEHLESQHNLQLGNPQNLVYVDELIWKIEETISKLVCIYCNKVFPERNVLKEHMRKKLHKRINPIDKGYDKYFVINYVEFKGSEKSERHDVLTLTEEQNKDEEYGDWCEKEDKVICLFCDKKETNINTLCLHMEADHEFDFGEITKCYDFYQKVKLINYIRRATHQRRCFYCGLTFKSSKLLQEHLFDEQHCKLPEKAVFEDAQYYFPTYENDAFLYLIDDVEE